MKWNCRWEEVYKDPVKHDELVKYEDPDNFIFKNMLKLADFKDKVILDFGAGTGRVTKIFAKVAKKVYALDLQPSQINFLRKKNIKNIIPKVGSCEELPYKDNFFDIVVSTHAFGGRNKKKTLKEVLRVLKPGGNYIFVDAYHQGEFISIWEKYSDPGVRAIFKKNYDEIKDMGLKTKIINNNWKFPSVKKAVEQLGYVLGGNVDKYLIKNKKKEVKMKDFIVYGVK